MNFRDSYYVVNIEAGVRSIVIFTSKISNAALLRFYIDIDYDCRCLKPLRNRISAEVSMFVLEVVSSSSILRSLSVIRT